MTALIKLLKARQKEMTVRAIAQQHKLECMLRRTEIGLRATTGEIIAPIGEPESRIDTLILAVEQYTKVTIKRASR